jgi:hypothetical protein
VVSFTAARRCARAGVVVALLGLALLLADLVYLPLWGGELVVRSGPRDPRAVPVTSLSGGEQFAYHQKSKTGEIPLVLPLDIHPGDGPIAVVTRDWSWQFDTRFGPSLMELTPERLTYAMGKRERLRRTKKGGPADPNLNLHALGGSYVQQGLYDLQDGKAYYLLLPVSAGRRDDYYEVWVRRRAPDEAGKYLFWGFVLFATGLGAAFAAAHWSRRGAPFLRTR